jgi:pectate lyase
VSTNRTYRVRLESIGSVDRVYVDGKLLLDVDDPVLAQTGSAGLATYKARADFDNVMVSPSPHTSIFTNDFAAHTGGWKLTGTGQWQLQSGAFGQNSIGGDARALIGTPTDDQIVQASVRPTAYAAASGTQERWAGLMARYTNDSNYYYLSMRSGNTLSLRKVYLGAITTLATVPLTVNLNAAHTLRLEAVGNQLRGYVDGAFALQASDSSMLSGQAGLVTYKAATNFDDFDAYQP